MNLNSPMKGLFWNCRGIRKKCLSYVSELIKEHKFDFLCIQETMVEYFLDSCFRQVDPGREYMWDWTPSTSKSGGILSVMKLDRFDVGSRFQGEFVLQHNLWDKQMGIKWNILNVYGAAHDDKKDKFLSELAACCSKNKEPYLVGGR
jgi:exonuclease III